MSEPKNRPRRAKTPEEQENILINLANKLAMKKLMDGTASSQLICQVLSLGSEKKRLENEKLKSEVELANAKVKQLEENISSKAIASEAIAAFKRYSGHQNDEEDDYDDY